MKIRKVLAVLLIVLSVVPLTISALISLTYFNHENEKLIDQSLTAVAKSNAQSIKAFFGERENELLNLAKHPASGLALSSGSLASTGDFRLAAGRSVNFATSGGDICNMFAVNSAGQSTAVLAQESILESELDAAVANASALAQGEVYTSALFQGEHGQHYLIATPIFWLEQQVGVLVAEVRTEFFHKLSEDGRFMSTGVITILDGQGTPVAIHSEAAQNADGSLTVKTRRTLSDAGGGAVFFYNGQEWKKGSLSPVYDTGWVVVSSIDRSELEAPVRKAAFISIGVLVLLLSMAAAAYLYIANSFSTQLSELVQSIRKVLAGDYSTRIPTKGGGELGEISSAFNELVATIEKDTKELRMRDERHHIVMSLSESIIIEWNMEQDTLYASPNWFGKFLYLPPQDHVRCRIMETSKIHEEDKPTVASMIEQCERGAEIVEGELRIRKQDGDFIWCRVRLTSMLDGQDKPTKVMGAIIDIDREKREQESLLIRSETDTLTGFYNKGATEKLIKEYLKGEGKNERHALMIIDIDNFKQINDNLGHLFGDAVLTEIASKVKKLFRSSDIIGRIGGDEFMVLLKGVSSDQQGIDKAAALVDVFRRSFVGDNQSYSISGSIGISMFPDDGVTFSQLYKNADTALYYAKNNGKDCYAVYGSICEINHPVEYTGNSVSRIRNTTDSRALAGGVSSGVLVEYIFRLLYQSRDTQSAINMIMELVGKEFGVSRVYIIESSPDSDLCENIYQWHDEYATPPVRPIQAVPGGFAQSYRNYFNENGIFYCSNLSMLPPSLRKPLKEQNVRSMLQCAIMDGNDVAGVVGFDECSGNRLWTQSEINTLVLISNMVSTFILKKNVQKRLIQSYEMTQRVMDNLDSFAYVVDRQTYEVLFMNKKLEIDKPGLRIGEPCYKAFWDGRNTPCLDCPTRKLYAMNKSCETEMYNSHLDLWFRVVTTEMQWIDGRQVYLICYTDITKYKQDSDKLQYV